MALAKINAKLAGGSTDSIVIVVTPPVQNGSLTYNGAEQSPIWTDYDPEQIEMTGETSATDAGSHVVNCTPMGNCRWSDGSQDTVRVTWTMAKATPILSAGIADAVVYGSTGTIVLEGNAGNGAVTATSSDTSSVTVQGMTVECVGVSANPVTITIEVAETTNYLSGTTTCDVTTAKAAGSVSLSAASGTVAYGTPGTFTVTNNLSGSELSVTSSNSAYVDASISGNTVTVNVVEIGASAQVITVTSAATANYNAASATYVVTSTKATGRITLSATSGTVTYGTPKTFTVTGNTSGGALSVTSASTAYATASISGNTVTVNCVQYRAATTTITVTSAATANYNAATATFTMTAARATGTISLSATSATLNTSTPSTTITVTTNSDGAITATSSDTSVCTASVSGKTVTISGSKSGSATVTIAVAEGNYTAVNKTVSVSVTADIPVNMLSGRTLADVQSIFQSGQGANYFKAGDYFDITFPKKITLYNDNYSLQANSTWRVVCLGIDHNSNIEGTNRGHFCIGKTTDNIEIAFYHMQMNSTGTNSGGWKSCEIKTWLNGTFYNALPTDLKNVISTCTKYTDNTGGCSNAASNVTATSQKIWLMALHEVISYTSLYTNTYEKNKQKQYDYYKNGNSILRYPHFSYSHLGMWWLRSPYCYDDGSSTKSYESNFICINNAGHIAEGNANDPLCFVPCFTIS